MAELIGALLAIAAAAVAIAIVALLPARVPRVAALQRPMGPAAQQPGAVTQTVYRAIAAVHARADQPLVVGGPAQPAGER